jgi:hypothetical protein
MYNSAALQEGWPRAPVSSEAVMILTDDECLHSTLQQQRYTIKNLKLHTNLLATSQLPPINVMEASEI